MIHIDNPEKQNHEKSQKPHRTVKPAISPNL